MKIIIYLDELKMLEEEGFGKLFLIEEQKMLATTTTLEFNFQNLFFKPAPFYLENKFISRLRDRELTEQYYCSMFRKEIPVDLIKCVEKFHPHVRDIDITQTLKASRGKIIILINKYLNKPYLYT